MDLSQLFNPPEKHRLFSIESEEVSLVDRAANKRKFVIVKRSDDMNSKIGKLALPGPVKAGVLALTTEALERLMAVVQEVKDAQEVGEGALPSELLDELSWISKTLLSIGDQYPSPGSKAQETKVEGEDTTKVEETKVEEEKAQETKVEGEDTTKVEETKVEEEKAQETKVEGEDTTKVEETKVEEEKAQETKVGETQKNQVTKADMASFAKELQEGLMAKFSELLGGAIGKVEKRVAALEGETADPRGQTVETRKRNGEVDWPEDLAS